jgi:uncharacterized protein (DUF302 family)
MKISVTCFAVITLVLAAFTAPVFADVGPVVTTRIKGDFQDTSDSIESSIIGKGINISHISPASQMLNRTGPAFGYKDTVYSDAKTYEFCSAEISQKLSRSNPDNIVLCPFTISVYTLTAEPGYVRISYRVPVGEAGSEDIVKQVVELISSIIEDATW